MNIRHSVTIFGTVAFGATTLLGTGIAHAEPQTIDWGIHKDGWHIDIANHSDTPLSAFVVGPFSNYESRTGDLNIGNVAHVHGKKSSLGEAPADIDFEFRESRGAFVPGIAVQVSSTFYFPTGDCLVNFTPRLKCEILKGKASEPIMVVISNK